MDYTAKTATLKGSVLREGDWLSLNGSTGEVLQGKQPVKAPELSGAWAGVALESFESRSCVCSAAPRRSCLQCCPACSRQKCKFAA